MKNRIMTCVFLIGIFGIAIASIFLKDKEISVFERRKLTQFPKVDADFTQKLDDYLVDQIVFRDELIGLNSGINRKVLGKIDDKNVYIIDDNIYEINHTLDKNKCIKFYEKLNYITQNYFNFANVYYTIIPDKSYFLDQTKYLKMDYNQMYKILKDNINGKYIDITNMLTANDYYRTDIHWKQENLLDVANKILKNMGNSLINVEYNIKEYNNFYGASYSKGNKNIEPDTLSYLYNDDINKLYAYHLEFGNKDIYDEEKLHGVDSYDVFLSGPSSYIEIENPNAKQDKTLILFRDSFGSSITPLFIPYYSKTIIIDLRYIDFSYISEELKQEDCDVLYLYSTLIINNSDILKVNY